MTDCEKAMNDREKLYSSDEMNENGIDFYKHDPVATFQFCQPRYVSRIRKLKEKYPDQVEITAVNKDGSIVGHIPAKWIKINPGIEMTEERKRKMAEQMKKDFQNAETARCE